MNEQPRPLFSRRFLVLILLVNLGLIILTAANVLAGDAPQAAAAQTAPGLFEAVEFSAAADAPTAQAGGGGTTLRERFVRINFDQLGGLQADAATADAIAAPQVTLNLFPDAVFTATQEEIRPTDSGGYIWDGTLSGVDFGTFKMVINNGQALGRVQSLFANYVINPVGGDLYQIQEVDIPALTRQAESINDAVPPPASFAGVLAQADPPPPTGGDDASIIDVLVIYSPAALAARGGQTGMNNLILWAEDDTNQAYADSLINQRINVTGQAQVAFPRTNSLTILEQMQRQGDGFMDQIHIFRDQARADLVMMILDETDLTDSLCGLAYLQTSVVNAFESFAFGLVVESCVLGNFSFAHELGHNMGARHDWFVDPDTTPYAFAKGFVNPGTTSSTRWRTIMAYNNRCVVSGFNCTRLMRFSNPDVLSGSAWGNSPTGVSGGLQPSDNALALDLTALNTANFRDSSIPDDFNSARDVTGSNYTDTVNRVSFAFASNDDPVLGCLGRRGANTLWYEVVPSLSGDLILNTFSSNYDTVLSIWTGSRGALTNRGCNDNAPGSAQSQLMVPVTAGTPYFIQVAATNDVGTSASTARLNVISGPPEVAPTPLTPANAASTTDDTPTFTWSNEITASSYDLAFGPTNPPTTVVAVSGSSFTWVTSLLPDTYYWQVRSKNSFGPGPWSAVRSLVIESATGAAPIRNRYTGNPTLTWNPISNAVTYELQIAASPAFTLLAYSQAGINSLSHSVTASPPLGQGMYYWRVRAQLPGGTFSPWSAVDVFAIDLP
jgi:hypothetical protein